jgi:hypothetical protein
MGTRGRPRHVPTEEKRKEAVLLGAAGCPNHEIATLMGIDTKTLLKYYREEIDLGKARALSRVRRNAFQCAFDKQPWAICFLMKTLGGWSESPKKIAMTDPDGNPIRQAPIFQVSFEDGGPGEDCVYVTPPPKTRGSDEEDPEAQDG